MRNAFAPDVTAFIIAGGKSTRMGRDKAFMDWEGRSLLASALGVARSITPDVRIVGSREKFETFAPVVEDIFRDCGPLGGIHAALSATPTELNLILAVDLPFIPTRFLQYLISQAREAVEAAVVVPHGNGRVQPLCAVYRRAFAGVAENALRAGRNRIDLLFDVVSARVIDEKQLTNAGFLPDIFFNLNTPEEMEAGKRRA